VPIQIKAIGNIEAYTSVAIKSQVSGQIGIDEVATAIGDANVNLPTGTLDGTKQAAQINSIRVSYTHDLHELECYWL
jgi:hypothetical protein